LTEKIFLKENQIYPLKSISPQGTSSFLGKTETSFRRGDFPQGNKIFFRTRQVFFKKIQFFFRRRQVKGLYWGRIEIFPSGDATSPSGKS